MLSVKKLVRKILPPALPQVNDFYKVNSLDSAIAYLKHNQNQVNEIVDYCIKTKNSKFDEVATILISIVLAIIAGLETLPFVNIIWIAPLVLILINTFYDKETMISIDYILLAYTQLNENGVDN